MKLYRIKRKSDGRFYKGKSKFTLFGTFFRLEQIEANLRWVKTIENDLEIIMYDVDENIKIDLNNINLEEIKEILLRDEAINTVLSNN